MDTAGLQAHHYSQIHVQSYNISKSYTSSLNKNILSICMHGMY